ncbi:hypothetical protein GCM10009676_21590 [Prauserella halophila]|uniref:SCP2 domain-containing protein n=1 Tax=Prauserella halophila TaxID=185641 RepID=A0ABN1W6J1_9PSEU|nr:SCP2 sterol-binding domain-containing protein [Prauserella halophila]MCP2235648.1 SCP-2 sterol transfer family protein [Prauserella halophila]
MGTAEKVYELLSGISRKSESAVIYRAVGATARIVIDNSQEVLLDRQGVVTQSAHHGDTDLTIHLSSPDVTALVAGDLSITRMVTSGCLVAKGPIFQSIGVIRAISQLQHEEE